MKGITKNNRDITLREMSHVGCFHPSRINFLLLNTRDVRHKQLTSKFWGHTGVLECWRSRKFSRMKRGSRSTVAVLLLLTRTQVTEIVLHQMGWRLNSKSVLGWNTRSLWQLAFMTIFNRSCNLPGTRLSRTGWVIRNFSCN